MSNDGVWVAFLCGTTDARALCIGNTDTLVIDEILTMPMGETVAGVEISGDGMVVTYTHTDTTPRQVWAYDQNTMTHEMVSVDFDDKPGDADSREAKPSGNGRFVVFNSLAGNLVDDDTISWDVFVRDRLMQTTTRVSLAFNGDEGDEPSGRDGPPSISVDGNLITFNSEAENLVQGDIDDDDPPYEFESQDSFFVDIAGNSILRMSEVTGSFQGGDSNSYCSGLSGDGNYGIFVTRAENLYPGASEISLLRWNRATGGFTYINEPISGVPQFDIGLRNGCLFDSNHDGSIVYFATTADNLVAGDTNNSRDVFAWQSGNVTILQPEIDAEPFFALEASTNGLGDNIAMLAANESQSRVGIVIMSRGDISPPELINLELIPDGIMLQGVIADLEGIASEIGRGGADITNAEFSIDGGGWMAFTPVDGSFDSPIEPIHAFLDTGPLVQGTHTVCSRATDANGNTGIGQCIDFEVVAGGAVEDFMLVCRHTPLWPQPGDTVRVVMGAFDPADTNVFLPVDRTEIWFDDPAMPVEVNDFFGTSSLSYESDTLSQGSFVYGCRAILDGDVIFSGWRRVAVGQPGPNTPIPVTITGPSSHRIDVVFVPDVDTYPTGGSDPVFLEDIRQIIRRSFYFYPFYNRFQHLFNFWISLNTGDAEREVDAMGDTISKTIVKPMGWEQTFSFANVGAVIHKQGFRDFAKNRFFSSDATEFRTIRHELGHTPFGLSDEYSPNTTHFEPITRPNVYETLEDCEFDSFNLGRVPEDCRELPSDIDDETHYTSEPAGGDLMFDNGPPQAADIRRIEWKFDQCGGGAC